MEIAPNVHLIPNIVCNPYLIRDADGLTLVDAGLPGSQKKILAYIASLGLTAADLKRILITHSDFDHVGALLAVKKASGARVYASRIEATAIATGKPSRAPRPSNPLARLLMATMGSMIKAPALQVDEIVSDGQVLPVLGGLTVLDTPGHTPGHISFFSPSAGVLFCGDSIVVGKQGMEASRAGVTWDRAAADASVRREAALGARVVCSGHGPVVTDALGKYPAV